MNPTPCEVKSIERRVGCSADDFVGTHSVQPGSRPEAYHFAGSSQHEESLELSLFDQLPVEIITQIFVFLLSSTDGRTARFNIAAQLAGVSKRLRSIAISTPTLWTSYDITPAGKSEQPLASLLTRSSTLPLDITLRFLPTHRYPSCHHLRFLNKESYRWRSLEVATLGDFLHSSVQDAMPRSLPTLQELTLNHDGRQSTAGTLFMLLQFPDLRRLGTANVDIRWDDIGRLRRLEEITMHSTYWEGLDFPPFLDVLRINPGLRRIHMEVMVFLTMDDWGPRPVLPVVMPSLQSLRLLKIGSDGLISRLLPILHAPRLEELLLSGTGGRGRDSQAWDLSGDLHLPALQRLALLEVPAAQATIDYFVSRLPRLTHVIIGDLQRIAGPGIPWLGIADLLRAKHPDIRLESLVLRGMLPKTRWRMSTSSRRSGAQPLPTGISLGGAMLVEEGLVQLMGEMKLSVWNEPSVRGFGSWIWFKGNVWQEDGVQRADDMMEGRWPSTSVNVRPL